MIRTRLGLYQYVTVDRRTAGRDGTRSFDQRPALVTTAYPPTLGGAASQTRPRDPGATVIIVEAAYLRGRLIGNGDRDCGTEQVEAIDRYLVQLAELRFNRPAQLRWGNSLPATAAEVTRNQCAGSDVVVIASSQIIDEAVRIALDLNTSIRVWSVQETAGESVPDPRPPIVEVYSVHVEDLARRMSPDGYPARVVAPKIPAGRLTPTSTSEDVQRGSSPVGSPPDSLWYLDVVLYQRPVDGITGRGNAHALKCQAILLGRTYAERWRSVVNDETCEQVIAAKSGLIVPGRLYGDLLTFAESQGLSIHGAHLIKDYLRRGFWEQLCPKDHDRRVDRAA